MLENTLAYSKLKTGDALWGAEIYYYYYYLWGWDWVPRYLLKSLGI
jgi:hypothetical protein